MIPIIPILTTIGTIVSGVAAVVKTVKDIFQEDEQSNNEIRNMQPYNSEDKSVNQLQNLKSILNDIKDNKKSRIKKLEEQFISHLEEMFNSIESWIKENMGELSEDIDISSFRYNFEKLKNDFSRSFYDDINGKISIGDSKCLEILEIKAPEKRLVEMNSYIEEVIKNQFDKYFVDLDYIANNTIEYIRKSIDRVNKTKKESVENIKKELEENIKLSKSEIEEKRKEYDKREKIVNNLLETIKL